MHWQFKDGNTKFCSEIDDIDFSTNMDKYKEVKARFDKWYK